MINSVQETALALTSNTSAVTFANDVVRTGSATCCGWLQHDTGSSQFQILKPGIYEILYSSNITSATSGIVGLAIFVNNVPLTGTEMDETIATTNEYTNIATSRLIRVCPGASTIITVASVPSIDTTATQIPTIKNASLIIKKVC